MKIAILGCGAMGSVYAGLLASAGHEVWAVDTWREHVEAMRAKGLRLEGASGDRTVKLNATLTASDAGVCDLVDHRHQGARRRSRRAERASRCSGRRRSCSRSRTASAGRTSPPASSAASASRSAWSAASARRCAARGMRITTAWSSSGSASSQAR